jgi:hypothetical protein
VGAVLALPAALWLSLRAVELDPGVRAEGRSTTLAVPGSTAQRLSSGSLTPGAAVRVDEGTVRADATYALRLWSSEAQTGTGALQTASARLELRPDSTERLELLASGLQGRIDPLTDSFHAVQPGAPYLIAPAASLPYQWLHGALRGELASSERTTLGAGAAWSGSRGMTDEARLALSPQRVVSADAFVAHRVSELDLLRTGATAARTSTDLASGTVSSASASVSASWHRRLAPLAEGWLELGGGAIEAVQGGATRAPRAYPVAELGSALGAPHRLRAELSARWTTFVDPLTGEVVPMAEARGAVEWTAAERVTLTASTTARRSSDGASELAFADLWLRWALERRLSLEAGLAGRSQRDVRQAVPSFSEGAVMGAVVYGGVPR